MRHGGRDGLSAPSKVLEIWTEELRYAWAHAPGGLLTVTMHPECIGRGHRMAMLERFIDAAAALDGVVFDRSIAMSSGWLAAAARRLQPRRQRCRPATIAGSQHRLGEPAR